MDTLDREIINRLQGGIVVCDQPFAVIADEFGITEAELIERVQRLLDSGVLTRFGPLFQAERLGGALTLCALHAPDERFDEITEIVNGFREVAHNYRRDHRLNMWFVLATETPEAIESTLQALTTATGCTIYNLPKLDEFYVGLRLSA